MTKDLFQKAKYSEIPKIKDSLLKPIAKAMVNISTKVKKGEHVLITYDADGRQLAHELARLSIQKGARVISHVRDVEMSKVLATFSSERDIMRSTGFMDLQIQQADVVFIIRANRDIETMAQVPSEKMAMVTHAGRPIGGDYRVNFTRWCLILWPTLQEAEFEGLNYQEYVKLFLNSCNQPWGKIEEAQKVLVGLLDKAYILTLIANPNDSDPLRRTELSMNIEPMRFANSTIDCNFPGSEVFSSPVKKSVEGQLFAPGKYSYDGHIMENIYFEVKNGHIQNEKARVGGEYLQNILNRDEGARYFGEVALGTNPGLRRRLFNPLLNEKVGGSFHITPGKAYEMEMYDGKVVNVDNGNRSDIHWDITIPMLAAYGGGEVLLDGKVLQKDGKFVDPRLAVLNKGLLN